MGINEIKRCAVFLDRDGVINTPIIRSNRPYPPRDISELTIISGVSENLKKLHDAGFLLIVVTNQPDVARGTQTAAAVEEINRALIKNLPIDDFIVCYHDDSDMCSCRKPKAGMLLAACNKFNIDLKNSYMIGDRNKDIIAGYIAGCTTILIDYEYNEQILIKPNLQVTTLAAATRYILTIRKL
jgi:D-glycero-D-manno-heptose 1,7-bisphosphate phosphatase